MSETREQKDEANEKGEEKDGELDEKFSKDLEAWVSRFLDLRTKMTDMRKEWAAWLAGRSFTQIAEIKRVFREKRILKAGVIDLLVQFGRGQIPEYLAMEERIPASLLRRLPESTLKKLRDPKRNVQILKPDLKSTYYKPQDRLTKVEWSQVLDKRTGKLIELSEHQRPLVTKTHKKPAAKGEMPTAISATAAPDGQFIVLQFDDAQCKPARVAISLLRTWLK